MEYSQSIPILICPNLWRFRSKVEGVHNECNGYILKIAGAVILIDPPEDLTSRVVNMVCPQARVENIFITHIQHEHVAGACHHAQAVVHVPVGDEYLCKGVEFYNQHIQTWPEPWDWETRGNYQGHLAGAKNERPCAQRVKLGPSARAGDSILGFEVISSPGHGKNAVTFMMTLDGKRIAFCGDLIYGEGQLWNWFDCDWDYGPEMGQRALVDSSRRLGQALPDVLCPAHGDILYRPGEALKMLEENILRVLSRSQEPAPEAVNFPECDSRAAGWRQVSPHIHQWKNGNSVIIVSSIGTALVIDDGLCIWEPLEKRISRHDSIFEQAKSALGISKIEWIVPTHYHGDHIEFIPHLAQKEGARVICLESITGPMEHPEEYNLACPLGWYGSGIEKLDIDLRVPEGYVLDWNEYKFRFFHLGGQTRYHQGIEAIIDGLQTLFVGDAFWGTSTHAAPILCWNEAEPVRAGWIFALSRMIERKPDLLVCGHGSSLSDPMPYLGASLQAWQNRLENFDRLNPRANRDEFFSPFYFCPDNRL